MGSVLSMVLLAVTAASLLLQLRTVRRAGTSGLAPSTWFGLVASTLVWLGYGVAMREQTVIVVNLVVLAVASALVVTIVRSTGMSRARLAPYVVGPGLAWCGAWVAGAPWLLGVAGTVLVIGRLLPQLVRAVQVVDRSGVSVGAWLGNAGTNAVWAVYGFDTGDPFVSWPSVASVTLSLLVVGAVRRPAVDRIPQGSGPTGTIRQRALARASRSRSPRTS